MALEYAKNCYNRSLQSLLGSQIDIRSFFSSKKTVILPCNKRRFSNNNMEPMNKYLAIIAMALA